MSFSGRDGSLWMGDIMDYMDESFIQAAFRAMGEDLVMVRIIKNKYNTLNVGYCFVHFPDEQTALRVMHKLNGKIVPHSQPPTRFMLNHSSANNPNQRREFSLFVGDLEAHVDDEILYKAFATRYSSIRAARVIYDKTTKLSRGYAFVRFGTEDEHKDALAHMNGFTGLGSKPIRVSIAVPKRALATNNTAGTQAIPQSAGNSSDYNAYYEQYWYNYNAWQNYGCYDANAYGMGYGYGQYSGVDGSAQGGTAAGDKDGNEVVEHDTPLDLERQNRDYVLRCEEFWDALDSSRWLQPDTLNPEMGIHVK